MLFLVTCLGRLVRVLISSKLGVRVTISFSSSKPFKARFFSNAASIARF